MSVPTEYTVLLAQLRTRVERLEAVATPELAWPGGGGGGRRVNVTARNCIDENSPGSAYTDCGDFKYSSDDDKTRAVLLKFEVPVRRLDGLYLALGGAASQRRVLIESDSIDNSFDGRAELHVTPVKADWDPASITWSQFQALDAEDDNAKFTHLFLPDLSSQDNINWKAGYRADNSSDADATVAHEGIGLVYPGGGNVAGEEPSGDPITWYGLLIEPKVIPALAPGDFKMTGIIDVDDEDVNGKDASFAVLI